MIAIGEISHVYPDPQASDSTSSLIHRGANFSTIRIIFPCDLSELRVVEDYQRKSTLSGLASAGGLWTFLAGIFAALFGTSMMRILFGLKPLSVFGLAHRFPKGRMKEACATAYPHGPEDIAVSPASRGLLSLMYDHLLDVDSCMPKADKKLVGESEPDNAAHGVDVELQPVETEKPG